MQENWKCWRLLGLLAPMALLYMAFHDYPVRNIIVYYPQKQQEQKSCGYITVQVLTGMRLGNLMFQYAALYGMAKMTNKTPIVPINSDMDQLYRIYNVTIERRNTSAMNFTKYYHPRGQCCTYSTELAKQIVTCGENTYAGVYLFSYLWWIKNANDIKSEFSLKAKEERKCWDALFNELAIHGYNRSNVTLVGIHARRGDFTRSDKIKFGHMATTESYIYRAVAYMRKKLKRTDKRIVFMFFGDDRGWNLRVARNVTNSVVPAMMEPHVDLCMLSLTDNMIVGTGTYSWWGAFLRSKGIVTYQKEQEISGSSAAREFNDDYSEYVLPSWTPL